MGRISRFFTWLENYRFVPEYIKISQDSEGRLSGKFLGPWSDVIFMEQILLAVISQTRNEELGYIPDENWTDELLLMILKMKEAGLKVSEFGLRRRAYSWMQDTVTEYLIKYGGDMYVGSSSPYHAQMSGLSPKGTVAHLWYLNHGARYGVEHANQAASIAWRAVYGQDLGTGLTDTWGSDFYWATLTHGMARLIKSYRQDSGDPIEWTNHALLCLTHKSIMVDPGTVTLMYTDSLDSDKAIRIDKYAKQWFKTAYGIGGSFTNNIKFFKNTPTYKPLNIVVKPYAFSFDFGETWVKVAKVPDGMGKNIGDPTLIAKIIEIKHRYPFPYFK